MTTSSGLDGVARVIVGVDTHLDEHVAVAIDHHGTRLGEYRLGTTAKGYEDLETWAIGLGQVATFGVEGTGSYGAGLARHLARCGHKVIEVNRPDRSTRRRLGKSDPLDAEMAARSVLAGVARESPKSGVDQCRRSLRGEPGQLVVDTFDLAGELAVTTGKQPKCMLSCCYRRRQPTRAKANAAIYKPPGI